MAIYEYECPHGTRVREVAPMGSAPTEKRALCFKVDPDRDALYGSYCRFTRVWDFHHVEDRRHMRTGLSRATGEPYAQSRTEERAIEKLKGIEFIAPSEMPDQWKHLRAYHRHVKTGGNRLSPHEVNHEPFVSTKGDLLKKAAELGVTFG